MNKNKYYLAVGLVGLIITTAAVASITSAGWGSDDNIRQHKNMSIMNEKREVMNGIFESNDYSAWQEMMDEKANLLSERADVFSARADTIRELVTEENFEKFMEIHELKMDGKFEEAKALWEEMDLEGGIMGRGFHRGAFGK